MIKLKNGAEIPYNEDYDVFYQNLMDTIVKMSSREARELIKPDDAPGVFNEHLLKEIMDNCIYVVHQIFQMTQENENLAKFIVTGCLFNSIILSLQHLRNTPTLDSKNDETVH